MQKIEDKYLNCPTPPLSLLLLLLLSDTLATPLFSSPNPSFQIYNAPSLVLSYSLIPRCLNPSSPSSSSLPPFSNLIHFHYIYNPALQVALASDTANSDEKRLPSRFSAGWFMGLQI